MPVIYSPAAPWNGPYPQTVLDQYGNEWEAYGPNQIKKPKVELVICHELADAPSPDDTDAVLLIDKTNGCLLIKIGSAWVQPLNCKS